MFSSELKKRTCDIFMFPSSQWAGQLMLPAV